MALFKTKKEKEEELAKAAKEERKEEYSKILEKMKIKVPIPVETPARMVLPRSVEYAKFLQEIKAKPKTLYEKGCALAEKIFPIKPPASVESKMGEAIKASYLIATPKGALSLAALVGVILLTLVLIGMFLGLGGVFALFALLTVGGAAYYLYNYPMLQSRIMQMRMSADTVLAILYMIIYMRSSPNIEGGLKFAAQNLEGPLAWDMKKLIWDIEVGTYASADVALFSYVEKWKEKNKEFAEALHLLRGTAVAPSRRESIFQETLSVILNGSREHAKHYAAGLRMPMMLIHAMGVLLPVMGLVMFPVVIIFMADAIKPSFLMFGYDVLLPIALFFFMSYTLSTKPPTFSQPDISRVKGVPPIGKFALGKQIIPIWPFSLLVAVPLVIIAATGYASSDPATAVNYSLVSIIGLAGGIAIYCMLETYQKMKVRKDIEKIENEFSVALFQLGNQLSSGLPLELAVDKSIVALKDLKIADMFRMASLNMKKFGMTFDQALFDPNVGAIWYYPSKLIISIMQAILESSKKSVLAAADSMIVIANYLKDVHSVKEDIEEILGETLSSMRFLALFLAPMVAGVTVTMAVIILQILTSLGGALSGLMASGEATGAQGMMLVPWAIGGTPPITPQGFQMIVGIYMLEMALLLSTFINRIQYGEDIIGERSIMGNTVLIASFVYFISWVAVYSMFGSSIGELLSVGMT